MQSSSRTLHTVQAAFAGMRRVDYVKMVEGVAVRFSVVGIGHRFPVERPITPSVARELLRTFPCRHVLDEKAG
jgi:hypothetical protein